MDDRKTRFSLFKQVKSESNSERNFFLRFSETEETTCNDFVDNYILDG